MMTIYHNPECSKCIVTPEIIREHGAEVHVIEYAMRSRPSVGNTQFSKWQIRVVR